MKSKAQKIRQATPTTKGDYATLLSDIKIRIRQSQIRAALSANAEMIEMYWDTGRMIHQRQKKEGWGNAVIPHLSRNIRNDLPEIKGFSERNIGYVIRFAREYPLLSIVPQAVAQLIADIYRRIEKVPQPAAQIPSNQNEQSPILPQLAAKLTGTEKLSQLLPYRSVPHAEPPVRIFFHMVLAPFIFGIKSTTVYLPDLGFSRSMPKCGGFFILWGNHA